MHRPSTRAILEVLQPARLEAIARSQGIPLPADVPHAQVLRICAQLQAGDLRSLLAELEFEELKTLCRDLGFSTRLPNPTKSDLLDDLLGRRLAFLNVVREDALTSPATENSFGSDLLLPEDLPELLPGILSEEQTPPLPPPFPPPPPKPRLDRPAETRRGIGFEATLWQAADKLRNNMDAAEYKHVVLGLIFLKYASDAFEAAHDPESSVANAPPSSFWVPEAARWQRLSQAAGSPEIGAVLDAAMRAVERSNPSLRGVLPLHYDRPDLDKRRLGQLVELIGTIGLGRPEDLVRDILGRVYEYFLTSFAAAEGKNGGQFYTPRSVVELLVAMLAPYRGTVYDPACGSGGMFVQSERFIEEHGGRPGDIAIYGQESNPTTWRLARMNLAIRQIPCDLGPEHADSFLRDLHPTLRADYVLANPPFNARDWGREHLENDRRWAYGLPPENNANFAWVQHFIAHLGPRGVAGFVLANGAMSSQTAGEGEIRRGIVEDDLVDCMVALPSKLFYSTQIPVSLWFLARDKHDPRFRARPGETLFIDARELGTMTDRIHRTLTEADIHRIVATYHGWRGDSKTPTYHDLPGFCRAVTLGELREHGHTLVPGHYVGAAPDLEESTADFAERFEPLAREITAHLDRAAELETKIRALLARLEL